MLPLGTGSYRKLTERSCLRSAARCALQCCWSKPGTPSQPAQARCSVMLVLIITVPFPRHLEIFGNFTQMHGATSKYVLAVNTSGLTVSRDGTYKVPSWCLLPAACVGREGCQQEQGRAWVFCHTWSLTWGTKISRILLVWALRSCLNEVWSSSQACHGHVAHRSAFSSPRRTGARGGAGALACG